MRIPTHAVPSRAPQRSMSGYGRRAAYMIGALVLLFIHSAPPAARAAEPVPTLTLESALYAAEQRSLALTAQDRAVDAAQEMAVAAGRLPDPMLELGVDNLPVEGPMRYSLSDDFMTMRSVGLTQTLTRADKRRARSARFEREADVARMMKTAELAAVQRETALAWFERHYRERLVELLGRQRGEAALQVEAAEAAYRGGRGSQADVFAARAAVARIDDAILDTRASLERDLVMLARWVGEAAHAPLGDAPDITRVPSGVQALEHHLERHPDIALMAAKEAVARAEADVAREDRQADWSMSVMYSRRGSQFGDMVSVGVSVPLQWDRRNRQDRELASKLAQVEQARAEREETARAHLAEVRGMVARWQGNLQRLGEYERSLVPLAADGTQAALAAYRGGKAALAAVLEARRAEIETRVALLRIEMETAALWSELAYLIPETGAQPRAVSGEEYRK
jgi:outer membrane protein, heavy metal efflux system